MPAVNRSAGLSIFLCLAAWHIPFTAFAQQQETIFQEQGASFYIEPSEPGVVAGAGNLTDTFVFSGDVTGARCFELALKDGNSHLADFESPQLKGAVDGKATFTHRFRQAKQYKAILKAYKQQD